MNNSMSRVFFVIVILKISAVLKSINNSITLLIDVCFSISVFIVITNNIYQYQDIITFYLGELNNI